MKPVPYLSIESDSPPAPLCFSNGQYMATRPYPSLIFLLDLLFFTLEPDVFSNRGEKNYSYWYVSRSECPLICRLNAHNLHGLILQGLQFEWLRPTGGGFHPFYHGWISAISHLFLAPFWMWTIVVFYMTTNRSVLAALFWFLIGWVQVQNKD